MFWGTGYGEGVYYVTIGPFAAEDVGRTFRWEWTATGSWVLEYAINDGDFGVWPGPIEIAAGRTYRFRWMSRGATQACLTRVVWIITAPAAAASRAAQAEED